MTKELKKEVEDSGDVGGETPQALDVAQRLLTLETKLLLLEARVVLLEKQTTEASQALRAKPAEVTIYGSNRKPRDTRTK